MFPEPACIVEHDAEFFVFELPPRLEVMKVDTLKCRVLRLEDADAPPLLRMNFFQIAVALQQRD